MVEESDKQIIRETAAKYRAKRVVLFGSSLTPDKESRDIDIGVEGIEEQDFSPFTVNLCAPYRSRSMSLTCLRRAAS